MKQPTTATYHNQAYEIRRSSDLPNSSFGGSKPAYGTMCWETGRGHWSAGAGGLVARRRTDDGGRTIGGTGHWRGAAEYTFMYGEEALRTNGERRRSRCAGEQGARTNLGGGERKEPTFISDGKHRNF